ncbi:MAG: guanylate kinase [Nitriliruptoraceae bacterium]
MKQRPGQLVVLSGPSGVGKGTIHERVRARRPDMTLSVSATTRTPRKGEQHGIDYHFMTEEAFEGMVSEGRFLEHAIYAGHRYGTPLDSIEASLARDVTVILDIDVQGAQQVRAADPAALLIFLAPPSLAELERRLRHRGTEDDDAVARRLRRAAEELSMRDAFDVTIVNDDVDRCVDEVIAAIDGARSRR